MEARKISQLAQAAALSGGERLPVVQSGQTLGATVSQLREGMLPSGHAGSGGDAHAAAVAGGMAGFLSGSDKSKLDGIQAGASANSTDAYLLDRANHKGSQTISTVSGLQGALDAKAPMASPTFTGTVSAAGLAVSSGGLSLVGSRSSFTCNNEPYAIFMRHDPIAAGVYIGSPGNGVFAVYSQGGGELMQTDSFGNILPGIDSSQNLGAANKRYAQVYAVTGTINTSDGREKEAIAPVDPVLAGALLRAFDPVTFKWRDVDRPEEVMRRTTARQKTEPVSVVEDVVERVGDIFVRRKIERIVDRPLFAEHTVHDEAGAPLMDAEGWPVTHLEPVMEEVEEEVVISPAYSKINRRTHWGFVAQQVEQGLCETLGLGRDEARLRFAGLVHDNTVDRYGLRESQFIPILWTVLRGLLDRVETLEGTRLPA
jgi:hypothetical protein